MKPSDPNSVSPQLRQWLRSDRLLGIPHVGHVCAPLDESSASSDAPATPQPMPATAPTQPATATSAMNVAPPTRAGTTGPKEAQTALATLDAQFVRGCTRCALHTDRTQTVFGTGHAHPELVFVGEAPGADEDRAGVPFVGAAGRLLTRMIAAMTLTRDQVYICNVVKCRPPGNRTPTPEETACCSPYLFQQLAILRPRVIVTLGAPATKTLLATSQGITRLRGRFHDFPPASLADTGIATTPLMPTFHPAYLLRDPSKKADVWSDLQEVMRMLSIPLPGGR